VVTIVYKIRGRGRLQSGARDYNISRGFIDANQEFIAGRGNHAMLLQKAVHHDLSPGIPFSKPRVRNILSRMVNTIGKIPHVVKDISHESVIRAFAPVEFSYLFFQNVE
jgi:hypothetical protein